MDEIHVHKTKKSICVHFAESPCTCLGVKTRVYCAQESCKGFDTLDLCLVLQFFHNFFLITFYWSTFIASNIV